MLRPAQPSPGASARCGLAWVSLASARCARLRRLHRPASLHRVERRRARTRGHGRCRACQRRHGRLCARLLVFVGGRARRGRPRATPRRARTQRAHVPHSGAQRARRTLPRQPRGVYAAVRAGRHPARVRDHRPLPGCPRRAARVGRGRRRRAGHRHAHERAGLWQRGGRQGGRGTRLLGVRREHAVRARGGRRRRAVGDYTRAGPHGGALAARLGARRSHWRRRRRRPIARIARGEGRTHTRACARGHRHIRACARSVPPPARTTVHLHYCDPPRLAMP
mmetsp:Transcript_12131/g.51050  ORF Transcript_12131/g.51050 Transcript_12131/m.51050 type:complete len:280 (-) Transcript_12131:614-1453(-)